MIELGIEEVSADFYEKILKKTGNDKLMAYVICKFLQEMSWEEYINSYDEDEDIDEVIEEEQETSNEKENSEEKVITEDKPQLSIESPAVKIEE